MNISVNNIYRNNYYLKNLKSSNDIKSKKTIPNISNNEVAFKSGLTEIGYRVAMGSGVIILTTVLTGCCYAIGVAIQSYIRSHKDNLKTDMQPTSKDTNGRDEHIEQAKTQTEIQTESIILKVKKQAEQLKKSLPEVQSELQKDATEVIISGKRYYVVSNIDSIELYLLSRQKLNYIKMNTNGKLLEYVYKLDKRKQPKEGEVYKVKQYQNMDSPSDGVYSITFNKNNNQLIEVSFNCNSGKN